MRVLALVPNSLGWSPGQRSTIEAWERLLGEHGIAVEYSLFETAALRRVLYEPGHYASKAIRMLEAYGRRIASMRDLRDYDAVYLYREAALAGPALIERLVARTGVPIVYELDDPLHVPYTSSFNGPLSLLKFPGKVARICELASAVVVNSTMIRRFVEQHNDNVWQIPSVVDEHDFTYVPKRVRDDVCVGWSGSPSTAPNLAVVGDALRLLDGEPRSRVRLIGAPRFDISGFSYTSQPWRADTEVDDLRQLDVGLVPLPDVPWNHHKFLMKVAQYMTLGIVPVATPYGMITEDIQDGVNGFHASTTDEWVDRIRLLVRDDDLRLRLSQQAAADAAARYTVGANAEKIVGVFRSVAG